MLTRRAAASPLFEQAGGFGGLGALQARHAGPSAASSYFNPALLVDAPTGVSAGVLVIHTNIGVHVAARPPGADVPDGLADGAHADRRRLESYPIATDFLQNGRPASGTRPTPFAARPRQHGGSGDQTNTYEAVGLVFQLIEKRLAFGFYGLIPNVNFTSFNAFYVDEREQYFTNSLHPELYGDRLKALSIAFAGGARLHKTLSLGIGATVGISANARAPVYVADAGKLQDIQLNIDADAKIGLVPHAGLQWTPMPRLHVTATVHAPQRFEIDAKFKFLLASSVDQGSGLGYMYDYMPWRAGLGITYDLIAHGDLSWSATGSLLYERWSKYIDRQADRPKGAYEWGDTLSGAVGTRMQKNRFGFALDGQYKPTPVPRQTGRTNYVDNNTLGLTAVVDYGFDGFDRHWKLGLQLQCFRLIPRSQRKLPTPTNPQGVNNTPQLVWDEVADDARVFNVPVPGRDGLQTNNPGWPGFSSEGWVSSAGLYLSVSL